MLFFDLLESGVKYFLNLNLPMDVFGYIEETNPPEVRELLTEAHYFLQEILPPFATCAIKWRIPFTPCAETFAI